LTAPALRDKPQAQAGRGAADRPQAATSAARKKAARPVSKTPSKAAKPVSKSSAKKSVKTPAKAVKKAPAKVAGKAVVKATLKAPAKVPAKGKSSAKAPAKAAVKGKPLPKAAKPTPKAAKPTPKAAKPVNKTKAAAVRGAAKPVTKGPAKSSAKPSAKPSAKAVAKPSPKPASKPASKPAAQPTAVAPSRPAQAALPVAVAPVPAEIPTRKSKGRAVLAPVRAPVVPTHAPDAAKASYVSATERVIAPPPAAAVIRKDPKLANNWKSKRPEDLTDEEVKSMPDSEYMNEVQFAFFRLKLLKLKQDIHNSAGETTEHLREETIVVPDPADRATIEEEHALELRTRDRERKLLKKIEQSIARIDAGDYGYCDETGEPIGVARLIARPTASLSLEAQQRRELKQKMFGD